MPVGDDDVFVAGGFVRSEFKAQLRAERKREERRKDHTPPILSPLTIDERGARYNRPEDQGV